MNRKLFTFLFALGLASGSIQNLAEASEGKLGGAQIYKDACALCHGQNLEGQPKWQEPNEDGTFPAPPHDESGHTWHHDDEMLFNYVKFGGNELVPDGFKSAMPGFQQWLSDNEIKAVLSYIKSQWPEEKRQWQQNQN